MPTEPRCKDVASDSWCRTLPHFLLAVAMAYSSAAVASPVLRCVIEQGGQTWHAAFHPAADPYRVAPLPIDDHFRFKAVLVGEGASPDYLKIYVYYRAAGQYVLLQQADYVSPQPTQSDALDALTGSVRLYSPALGHEIRYGCALREEKS